MSTEYRDLLETAGAPALDEIDTLLARIHPDFRPCLLRMREALFRRDLTVASLRQAAARRGYEFSKAFREVYGQRPTRFISTKRLETACRLLRETDLPVGVIARLVGFTGIHAFGMRFRQEVGQSATEFRESVRGSQGAPA